MSRGVGCKMSGIDHILESKFYIVAEILMTQFIEVYHIRPCLRDFKWSLGTLSCSVSFLFVFGFFQNSPTSLPF